MNSGNSINQTIYFRIIVATALITVPFIFVILHLHPPLAVSFVAFIFFYCTLIVNTIFSINTFGRIMKQSMFQSICDAVLIFTYSILALQLAHNGIAFALLTFLFFIAAIKYRLAPEFHLHKKLFSQKVHYEYGGILISSLGMLASYQGFGTYASILWAVFFFGVTISMTLIKPLYRTTF